MYQGKFNKTKIVATIGPATSSVEMLEKIILAGVDVCRLNFSHGTYEQHQEVINNIRTVNEKLGANIALLQDLQGPKLRIGKVEGEIYLTENQFILVTTEEQISTSEILYVSYKRLVNDCKLGERILLNDGKVALEFVDKISETTLKAKVIAAGPLSSNKGFNLPDSNLSVPSLTKKDLADLEYGLSQEMDWVALSFVRSADDIIELKRLIALKGTHTKVIAKIEKPEAVANIDEIIKVSDGIMVARGDLGVEVPMQRVPLIQKTIVEKCLAAAKPCIIATQMMESMIVDSMPTRAEINDVANAVLDGADALMLSAETSVGKHPLRVIEIMSSIITDIESDRRTYYKGVKPTNDSPTFASDEICFTAVRMSDHLNASAIVAMTKSGFTGFRVASYRPEANVFIFTNNKRLLATLNLVWGVRGFFYDKFVSTDETFQDVVDMLKEANMVQSGQYVINCASMPIHKKQRTNTIKVTLID
ncbi:MAG: pyruvate kinase [Flavobacteriaceae bacterium]|nr:pyruvate kinase [Flavobacteriaceae bacterium]PHX76908.1 MAG: pyruvate kinase [Flavobacteriales bacterium]